ncbi:xaa-Pro aminopeptidase 3 [Parasteatoda tepidariorum]|uniref:xaa-Pro aminopeptidase 3 n=1 Tax=Parasteatoda tepidariorum TaxID=114398 RepID=UPI00077FE0F3|nr:xaa-Pro aminopeptidase 3 [Parasteatoda tepidariorum]
MSSGAIQRCQYLYFAFKTFQPMNLSKNFLHTSGRPVLLAQPTCMTHNHLLKLGEITPGLTSSVYHERRMKLVEKIVKNSPSDTERAHLIVIPSSSVLYMTEKIPYRFRQNSDFLYLSGFKEPDSILVIDTTTKKFPDFNTTMFIPKQTSYSEQWEGCKMNLKTAVEFLKIDRALYMFEFENYLQSFLKSDKKFSVWYDYLNVSPFQVHQTMRDFMAVHTGNVSMESPRSLLHRLRLIKCDAEIELMRKTCRIAAESMKEVMRFSHVNRQESHLDAKMEYECRLRGADFPSFPPVVAGGDRANTIHYIDNNQIISENHLVLMDAGCECHGYSSDLTRTWPVSGKFSGPQKELYEMLLSVQEQLITLCKSKLSLDHLFKIMCKKLGKGLGELRIIPENFTEVEASEAAFAFCPHHVSHYLGMDVHDTSTISRGITLQPGMVITIEPGVYISRNNMTVPDEYRGLCIRIEDDILITEDGCEVLTRDCPKSVEEIEELFKDQTIVQL